MQGRIPVVGSGRTITRIDRQAGLETTGPKTEARIALFQRKEVRRVNHIKEWWFVITDVITDPSCLQRSDGQIRTRKSQILRSKYSGIWWYMFFKYVETAICIRIVRRDCLP